ncbi:MlaD family protein [Planctomicrobium sp. SH661]|uniref:MlaD family protein n=1 Tax=Planctomicrobium sp. SH661 TaxID=3448124 RepID=UPI003F5B318B
MNERQLQYRVGLFVVLAMAVGAVLIFQFSDFKDLWRETYPLAVHFEEIPGLHLGSPVKQNGITIGTVQEIVLDEEAGGVLVIVAIYGNHQLRSDAQPHVSRSLFGDSKIEFSAGRSTQFIPPRSRLQGLAASDPMQAIERLEHTVSTTLSSFEATSREWQQVARNVNNLMDTNRGNLGDVVERAVLALDTFHEAMRAATSTFTEAGETLKVASNTLANANSLLADPELQANLRKTAAELPKIAEETRLTIASARTSMEQVSANLNTIQKATMPLAEESDVIVRKLSGSLVQLESLLTELNMFSQVINAKDGSLQKFASDPSLYKNLERSAAALTVLLENAAPALNDLRIFTDKVARHPELLGVGGAMRPSTGLKSSEVQQAGFSTPGK